VNLTFIMKFMTTAFQMIETISLTGTCYRSDDNFEVMVNYGTDIMVLTVGTVGERRFGFA